MKFKYIIEVLKWSNIYCYFVSNLNIESIISNLYDGA